MEPLKRRHEFDFNNIEWENSSNQKTGSTKTANESKNKVEYRRKNQFKGLLHFSLKI
jgi:hypothetical protein